MRVFVAAIIAALLLAPGALFGQAASAPASAQPPASPPHRPRVALVLSGGSALGIAHMGVIEEIERAGIPIDMVIGTSMGAIVGGLYAAGYSPARMEGVVEEIDWNGVFTEQRDSPGDRYYRLLQRDYPLQVGFDRQGLDANPGLLSGQNVLSLFMELTLHDLGVRDFDSLPVPYRAVAADILTGDKVVFSSGSLAEAMRASMSIPGIFRPYETAGHYLVDGGIVDNMPVDVARSMGADIVIAVETSAPLKKKADELKSALAVSSQSLELMIEGNMRASRKDADLFIAPDLTGFSEVSYGEAGQLIQRGRAAGEKAMPELRALAARIAERRPLVKPDEEPNRRAYGEPPIFDRLEVEGARPGDEQLARTAFEPFIGRRADRAQVKAAIDALFATGRFTFVKLDLAPDAGAAGDRATAVLQLVPESPPVNSILLGGDSRMVISPLSGTETGISPGLVLRNLSGKDSALFFDATFVGRREGYLEYFQPLGSLFFEPFARYLLQYDAPSAAEALSVGSYYQSIGGGAWAGVGLSRYADLRVRWTLERLQYSAGDATLATVGLGARIDTRRETIFPERGYSLDLLARWADPTFGGQLSFMTAECDVSGAIPLAGNLTLGVVGFVGTDFQGLLNIPSDLPSEQYFSLRRPGMFYGLEPWPTRDVGNHAAALALELRDRVGELNAILGGDLYVFANLSAGVVRAAADPSVDFFPPRLGGALGLGARLSSTFGFLVAAGVISDNNANGAVRPTLTIEIGTFSAQLEDRR